MECIVKKVDINALKPYVSNPRKNKEAIEQVARSIRAYGFQQPIVVDKDYTVIVGDTRLKAAKKLALKKVPIIVADKLNEQEVKAYRIADNRTHEFSFWDDKLLEIELDNVGDLYTGFEQINLDPLADEDDCPDIDEELPAITQLGDLWQLGEHRLLCGDSTNAEDVSKLLAGEKPHLMVTDPPYGGSFPFSVGMEFSMHKSYNAVT